MLKCMREYNMVYDTVQTQHYSQQHSSNTREVVIQPSATEPIFISRGWPQASIVTASKMARWWGARRWTASSRVTYKCNIWLYKWRATLAPPRGARRARTHRPLTLLYPSQLTCSVTFCFCGVEQGGRHSYSGRSRWPGRWVICKICNTTLFTILSILSFFANFVEHRRVFSRPEDGLTDVEEFKGVSHYVFKITSLLLQCKGAGILWEMTVYIVRLTHGDDHGKPTSLYIYSYVDNIHHFAQLNNELYLVRRQAGRPIDIQTYIFGRTDTLYILHFRYCSYSTLI